MSRLPFLLILALPLLACGSKVDLPGDQDDSGASTDTGSASGDSAPSSDTAPGPTDCPREACGPATGAPAAPSEKCWDGSTGGMTGRCLRTASGMCSWEYRECPPPKKCVTASDCGAPNAFCNVPIGLCGAAGTCALKPDGCDLLYAPVCGCNGKTYGNECAAKLEGATVSNKGECRTATTGCGAGCAKSEYCKHPDGACAAAGACTKTPTACPDIYAPVCGCDGRTYSNSCDAAQVAQSVAYKGTCEDGPG